jgi:putative oxidoreductase
MKRPDQLYGRASGRLSRLAFLPPLAARAMLATAFIVSSRRKFADLKGDVEYFRKLGIPAPEAMVPFVAGTELGCGTLLGLGLGTRLAALPLIGVMVVAIMTARRQDFHSFSDLTGVYEFSYIIILGYLATHGAGRISLDALAAHLRDRLERRAEILSETERLRAA